MSEDREGRSDRDGEDARDASDPVARFAVPLERVTRVASAVVVVVFALLVASAITGPTARLAVSAGLVAEGTSAWQVLRTVVQFGGFLLAVVGYLAFTDEWDVVDVARPSRIDTALVVGGAVGLLALQYGALLVLAEVGLTTGENRATVAAGDPVPYYLAMIAVSLLVVGPIEELLFRGVVQGGLRRAFDAGPAILIASLVFGVIHLPSIEGALPEQLAYVGVVVLLGCVLGLLYERTGNVVVPGLAHGAYNAAIYAVLLAGVL
ncbi:CPBP family intramembrane metalloprotease [Halorubrum sp. JWXQ-INN 858]|uniref:CPBP family intramembrane glutamic endopeptidase n=1 Tax=Halorubrum sp. JWXQ-INN 858 TaxID=2690782 RepID=UPI0013577161|nr:CPBP family intramembrane glutamic endopeptidase [Halorubrum sp. JWXQ-INN 858]MWV63733.1 CPBP family intramembrane metalloprotease [Halorubrum sp. JWXQ-INN 858]